VTVFLVNQNRVRRWTFFLEETFEQMITLRDIEALSDLTGRIRERRAATYSKCCFFSPEAGDSRSTQMNANLIK